MKSIVMPSIVQMERKAFEQLITEVPETLAPDARFSKPAKSSFGIVDLWNIQRKMKSAHRPFGRKRNTIYDYLYPQS